MKNGKVHRSGRFGTSLGMLAPLMTACLLLSTAAEPETSPVPLTLQAARVLSGEGYERRALLCETTLAAEESMDLPVYLLRPNEYCFLLAVCGSSGSITFAICDDEGTVLEESSYRHVNDALHILHLRPERTGRHHLRIINLGDSASRLALTYCYR